MNGFRVAICTAVGAITGGAKIYSSTSISLGAVLAMVWGLVAAISGFTWLKRFYRHSVAVLLTTVDITVLALCMHAGYRYLLANDPALVQHKLHASGLVLMGLLATSTCDFRGSCRCGPLPMTPQPTGCSLKATMQSMCSTMSNWRSSGSLA